MCSGTCRKTQIMSQANQKEWGTLDALHAHKGYRSLRSLLNLSMRMLESIGLLIVKDKRN